MNFNLTSDPWIPVRWLDGHSSSVSLHELFAQAAQIADLAVPPHERISIMRLLICITQATLGAPETSDDWKGWGDDLESGVAAYLLKWKEHFNLMGEGPRFLQAPIRKTANQKPTEGLPSAKLVPQLASGSNPTLFDHDADDKNPRSLSPEILAKGLLVFQNYFFGDLMGAPIKGQLDRETGVAGPALDALHTFFLGKSLKETVLLNCLDKGSLKPTEIGKPIWEINDNEENLKESYLGRLVPIPCRIWLSEDAKKTEIVPSTPYKNFYSADIREPSTAIATSKNKRWLLKKRPEKAIWRDLSCITILNKEEKNGPLIFLSHSQKKDILQLWCGEFVKEGKNFKASIESTFTVPFELFKPIGQLRYQGGVEYAENSERRLTEAVSVYLDTLRPKPKRLQKDANKDYPTRQSAKRHFWNALDQQSGILLELLVGAGTGADPMGASDFGEGKDPWTLAVRKAAREAYESTCPRQNPRQLQAYAAGLRVLYPASKKSLSKSKPKPPKATSLESPASIAS